MSRATKTSKGASLRTPIQKTPRTTETGSTALTGPTSTTSEELKTMNLEEEAKKFTAKKKPPAPPKPMTSRIYLAGQAMSALIMRNPGAVRREEIKREAFEWADFMLED